MRAFYNYLSTIYLKSYGSNYDRMLSGVGCHASADPVLRISAGMCNAPFHCMLPSKYWQ